MIASSSINSPFDSSLWLPMQDWEFFNCGDDHEGFKVRPSDSNLATTASKAYSFWGHNGHRILEGKLLEAQQPYPLLSDRTASQSDDAADFEHETPREDTFRTSRSLQHPVVRHKISQGTEASGGNQGKCPICIETMLRRTLQRHLRTVHGTLHPVFSYREHRCSLCSRVFSRNDVLNRHVEEKHHGRAWSDSKKNRLTSQHCWRCALQRDPCDDGEPCTHCNQYWKRTDIFVVDPIFLAVRYAIECSRPVCIGSCRTSDHSNVWRLQQLERALALRTRGITAVSQAIESMPECENPPHALEMVLLAYPATRHLGEDVDDPLHSMLRISQQEFFRMFAKILRYGNVFGSYSATMLKARQILQSERNVTSELRWLMDWVKGLRMLPSGSGLDGS